MQFVVVRRRQQEERVVGQDLFRRGNGRPGSEAEADQKTEIPRAGKANPKSEVRSPKETRIPEIRIRRLLCEPPTGSTVLRASDFDLPSDFGFRTSDFRLGADGAAG